MTQSCVELAVHDVSGMFHGALSALTAPFPPDLPLGGSAFGSAGWRQVGRSRACGKCERKEENHSNKEENGAKKIKH